MDQFITENKLKWVPYNKFENIKYLDKGGFGTIYEVTYNNYKVILKSLNYLNNSDESLNEFLNKWKIIDSNKIIRMYGFTKDPNTLNYMLVMEYANKGNLRGCLTEITKNWGQKLYMLYKIIIGLRDIHEKGLIHYNFHNGNILCNKYAENVYEIYISDYLRSYQIAKPFSKESSIYGIIPFMAPEILRGKPYTQASDIYSFSMIMWEFTSGIPPFDDKAHDLQLALSICNGERPEIIENTPQCFIDLMKKCWDEDPSKRPSASEILDIIEKWIFLSSNVEVNKELKSNIMEFINVPIGYNNLMVESHPQACYISHLLDFTSKELNKILEGSQELKDDDIEQELLKLEKIAEFYYQSSQNGLKEVCQNIQIKLVDLQQRNFKFEQDNQILRLNLAVQIKEFAEKENILQAQIIHLQSEKQALLTSNLTEQLEQNKLTNQQVQVQIDHLEQEKIDLQEKLTQTEANIQELKSLQESLIEQKEKLENELSQSQYNYKAVEQEKIKLHNMGRGLSQDHKLKAKLEKEINQLEQKLTIEEQIKMQLTQALHIKEDKVNGLEQGLIDIDYECIKRLEDKEKELSKVIEELVNKLTSGENTKEIHKEKEAKQRELIELQQELSKTSAFYNANRKKQVLNQANNFLKVKDNFLAVREEAIKRLQNCCNKLESFTNTIGDMKISKLADKFTKDFQNTLLRYSDGLLQLNKVYDSLMNIVQKNKELEVSFMVENMLKLNSFNLDEYNIFKFATNSQEGAKTQLNSDMMTEDIDSLRKNLNKLKSELKQEKKELKNLTAD